MQWTEAYAIGVAKIDSQHRRLIDMARRLESGAKLPDAAQEMGRVLKALVEYTRYHFKDEEDLMAQIRFAGREEHVRRHAELMDSVRRILHGIRSGRAMTAEDLIEFLRRWVLEHIEKEDRKIGRELARRRSKAGRGLAGMALVEKAPTQEIRSSLNILRSLLGRGLIGAGMAAAKKGELLEKLVKKFAPQSLTEVQAELGELASLVEDGLIEPEDGQRARERMAAKLELMPLLLQEESIAARFERLDGLLEERVISPERHAECRAALSAAL